MGLKINPKDPPKKKGEAERTKNSVLMPSYGLQNPGKDSFSPSTENKTPTGTRYDYQKDQSIAPIQYDLGPSAMYKKNKPLGPMAKLHGGPDNKAVGGLNSTGPEAMSRISKNIPPKSDTIRVSKKYKPGDFVEEYELEKEIKKQTGAFPQLSVQDYSKVEVDDKGRNIVVKKGPQATIRPRGTKEEMAERKIEKRNARVRKRSDKLGEKGSEKSQKITESYKKGKITSDLADQKRSEAFDREIKKANKAKYIMGSRKDAKARSKSMKN